jgi:hypothetical protein
MIAPVSDRINARRRQGFHHLFRCRPLGRESSSGVSESGGAASEYGSDQDQRSKLAQFASAVFNSSIPG